MIYFLTLQTNAFYFLGDYCPESQLPKCAVDPCTSAKCHSDIEDPICLADFCEDCNYVSFYNYMGERIMCKSKCFITKTITMQVI